MKVNKAKIAGAAVLVVGLASTSAFALNDLIDSSKRGVVDGGKNCIQSSGGVDICDGLFDSASAVLKPAAVKALKRNMGRLKAAKKIKIIGHADDRGGDSYNKNLSQKRANSVKEFLKEHGVKADITTIGMGEYKPMASNKTKRGMAINRRAQIIVQ